MKLLTLVLTAFMLALPGMTLCNEPEEMPSHVERAYHLGAGISSLGLTLSEIGSACAIGFFILYQC